MGLCQGHVKEVGLKHQGHVQCVDAIKKKPCDTSAATLPDEVKHGQCGRNNNAAVMLTTK